MALAVKVENLSKAYQLGEIGTGTLSRDLERWFSKVRGKEDPFLKVVETNDRTVAGKSDIVWSLKDINFEIHEGDAVGIIGRNGAGKSTLLKLLSRVTSPTMGTFKVKGRIASLLEVGTGFHPELTGRENIYLNGAILGMRKKEITRKFDEIVAFSGVERYVDTPVKRYSSGMYVRLAFAVAAHLESEILIVDEVLAVGDAEFQQKCLGKMEEVCEGQGRTILFVSHNMDAVSKLCTKGILLKDGQLLVHTNTDKCLQIYQNQSFTNNSEKWERKEKPNKPHFSSAAVKVGGKQPIVNLLITFSCNSPVDNVNKAFVAVDIKNSRGITVMQALPELLPFIRFTNNNEEYELKIEIVGLVPDKYYLSFWMGPHNTETYDYVEDIISFEIISSPTDGRIYPHTAEHGFLVPNSSVIKK